MLRREGSMLKIKPIQISRSPYKGFSLRAVSRTSYGARGIQSSACACNPPAGALSWLDADSGGRRLRGIPEALPSFKPWPWDTSPNHGSYSVLVCGAPVEGFKSLGEMLTTVVKSAARSARSPHWVSHTRASFRATNHFRHDSSVCC